MTEIEATLSAPLKIFHETKSLKGINFESSEGNAIYSRYFIRGNITDPIMDFITKDNIVTRGNLLILQSGELCSSICKINILVHFLFVCAIIGRSPLLSPHKEQLDRFAGIMMAFYT